ncbi:glycosyltransferase family 2 protein [Pontibacter sp. BT310]|jgi:glycosyltransferase involved in cell wall biosynthesis|uniref:Glycosyltransferase family 2 protein n=1 Tax=Pontibacter populi TaxID=890055 RepID=A0ABS6XCL0_9BACT|nr:MULTISPECIES: glycosyltransferase family 2 protein [Pontibacter]MBJ6118877.1 glycosyltransferase family 2 protein [Pontibacter sp. BT310]MBR0571305.1 glycosyltransferase family 2 protein [Microvirga sp. STS03]MBW3365731.1 glycosyltransferase family 2 protein [Pontibacter populi]
MQYPYDISVVVPLFNEEESLPELVRWIRRVMHAHEFSYEIILVDDGSTDRSWEVIQDLSADDNTVKGISFNRNYGKSAALHMGFQRCAGEVVITMDADLQDSPDEIPALYDMIKHQKYDLVSGWKQKRFDPLSKTIPTKLFNAATRKLSGIQLHDFNCGLKAYRQLVVKTIEVHGEMHRYIPVIAKWNGFTRIGEKVVQHQERKYGTTKFGLERFVYGFLDLLSISFVSRFKKRPMHFFGTMGTLMFVVGLGITIWLIVQKLFGLYSDGRVRDIVDQPLFFLALVTVILGVQLFLAGFLAEMMSMTSSKKNEYLVRDHIGSVKA